MITVIRALIAAAAIAHGVSTVQMDAVAKCESTYNPFAVNGPNEGLFQLSRYGKQRAFYARGYDNVYDPAQQSNFVAEQFAAHQQAAWTCYYIIGGLK